MSRNHLTCHLCGDFHKNVYYKEYKNLEVHFSQTHHICPYETCKAKCYVAFKTEDELKTHIDLEHNHGDKQKKDKVQANALLGFLDESSTPDDDGKGKKGRPGKDSHIKIKDKEGIDFNYYFSQKYAMIH